MRYSSDHTPRALTNVMFRVLFYFILFLLFCPGCERDVSPPDLSTCTRLEIRYPRSTLNYLLGDTALQKSVLSLDEREHIKSIDFFTVSDPECIKAFASNVSQGSYHGRLGRSTKVDMAPPIVVDCYRDDTHLISFTIGTDEIITDDRRIFKYPRGLLNSEIIDPPEMLPFKLRLRCGWHMQAIYTSGPLYRKEVTSYPEPGEWSDVVIRDRTNTSYVSEEKMIGFFKCSAASEGRCHYAMNPNCEPNSPPDMVLLFEAKAGWNQHGGSELFVFERHELRGGCVLLNDGTVKFIRTGDELKQLRWE